MTSIILELEGQSSVSVVVEGGVKDLLMDAAIKFCIPDPRDIVLTVAGKVVGDAEVRGMVEGTTVTLMPSSRCVAANALEQSGLEPTLAHYHMAAGSDNASTLRHFVAAGIHPDAPSPAGKTAALIAVQAQALDSLTQLVPLQANLNLADPTGVTPLYYASFMGDVAAVDTLVSGGVAANVGPDGSSPLMAAAANGHFDIVSTLLQAGAHPDGVCSAPFRCQAMTTSPRDSALESISSVVCSTVTYTPLCAAVARGDVDMVKALLHAGADVTRASGKDGVTPMYLAALKGNVLMVKLFAAHGEGTDIMHCGPKGLTPLHAAVHKGHAEIVSLLCSLGANPNLPTPDGMTPMYSACQSGNVKIMDTLLKYGSRKEKGKTTDNVVTSPVLEEGRRNKLPSFGVSKKSFSRLCHRLSLK